MGLSTLRAYALTLPLGKRSRVSSGLADVLSAPDDESGAGCVRNPETPGRSGGWGWEQSRERCAVRPAGGRGGGLGRPPLPPGSLHLRCSQSRRGGARPAGVRGGRSVGPRRGVHPTLLWPASRVQVSGRSAAGSCPHSAPGPGPRGLREPRAGSGACLSPRDAAPRGHCLASPAPG